MRSFPIPTIRKVEGAFEMTPVNEVENSEDLQVI